MNSRRHRFFALNALRGKVIALLFQEPSTRTACSFNAAAKKLGAQTIEIAGSSSSLAKGESLEDSVRMLASYTDLIAVRHPQRGAAKIAGSVCTVPVVNAGDGNGEHPTQALLDIYTILRYFPSLTSTSQNINEALHVVCVGDCRYGRTVQSLGCALANFNTVLTFVSPECLQLEESSMLNIVATYRRNGFDEGKRVNFAESLAQAAPKADIIYMTRLQTERLPPGTEVNYEPYCVSKGVLADCKRRMKVLHPLPRREEIPTEVEDHESMVFLEQARNGLFMRMAVLVALCANR